tara:strand:- start:62 stop:400 length:339 start_codon:yes stop_codon:yes gene_type:complete
MSTEEHEETPREQGTRATQKEERNSAIFSIISVLVILLIASPCICYFGAGLFQGVHILRTGQQNNPARQGFQKQGADWRGKYQRPERYNRRFDEADAGPDASLDTRPPETTE